MAKAAQRNANGELDRQLFNYPYYESLGLANRDGQVVASSHFYSNAWKEIQDQPFLKASLQGHIHFSRIIKSPNTGYWVFVISEPIKGPELKVQGVFFVVVGLSNFNDIFVTPLRLGERGFAFVYDSDGTILSHPDSDKVFKEKLTQFDFGRRMLSNSEGLSFGKWRDDERIVAYGILPPTNWFIGIAASRDELLWSARRIGIINNVGIIIDFDLRRTLDDVVQILAVRACEKKLELIYSIDPQVPALLKGDPGRLRQVIMNLANNVVKFTAKGEVLIDVTMVHQYGDSVELRFAVQDTGIGIPKDHQSKLFRSFSQVDSSTTRKFGGTGLGLAISKKLVTMMEGQIGVISKPDQGSTFWFTARFERQPNISEKTVTRPVSIAGNKILVVSDNKTRRRSLGNCLQQAWGCRYDCVEGPEEGLKMLQQGVQAHDPYVVALIDDILSKEDGKTFGQAIKSDPLLASIRLVLLTAGGMRGDAAIMNKIGFEAYLQKPVSQSLLFDCLIKLIGAEIRPADISRPTQMITNHSLLDSRKNLKKILLVEDNIINQKVALKFPDRLGCSAEVASDGRIAIKMLEEKRFDLVLMDVHMPNIDGYQTTELIRSSPNGGFNSDIPIVAMTARAMKGDRKKCLDAGMNDYLSKPINPEELAEKLDT